MKSIPVSSILYFLLSLGVLFVNANTFTDSQIFPKWMFMFTGLGVIGCFFSFYLFRGKGLFAMQNVVTTRLLYLVFFKPDTVYYNFSIYCLHIPSPTMLSVALIILPVLQEVYAQGYHLPSIFYNIQTKRFNGPVGVHCLLLS